MRFLPISDENVSIRSFVKWNSIDIIESQILQISSFLNSKFKKPNQFRTLHSVRGILLGYFTMEQQNGRIWDQHIPKWRLIINNSLAMSPN